MKYQRTKEERLKEVKRTTQFKNVRFNRLTGFWVGAKRYNGKRINVSGNTPVEAARNLNKRCRELGLDVPNPHADKISWKMIVREMNERRARREIVEMNNAWIENGKLFKTERSSKASSR